MIGQPESTQLREKLQRYLTIFASSELLSQLVRSTRDIYENKSILKRLPCSDSSIGYLARVVLVDIDQGKRFRKVECLKVLRAMVRNSRGTPHFEPETVRLLFRIYKHLIFVVPEDGQWAASVLIKGQLLTDNEIQWLIENYKRSVHPLNRLLLYPEYHPAISKWAEKLYRARQLPDREAELVALLIQDSIPPYVDRSNTDLVLRAVSRARIEDAAKEALLKELSRPQSYETLLELALKLEMPSLIRHMITELEKAEVA